MQQALIFQPVCVMAMLTLLVLCFIPYRRFKAGLAGQIVPEDFRYGESERVPLEARIPNRAWMNLLEAPLLFYVACLVQFATATVDALALQLAWVYVALRCLHSLIHLSYNRVPDRLVVFALSNGVLLVIWLRLSLSQFGGGS